MTHNTNTVWHSMSRGATHPYAKQESINAALALRRARYDSNTQGVSSIVSIQTPHMEGVENVNNHSCLSPTSISKNDDSTRRPDSNESEQYNHSTNDKRHVSIHSKITMIDVTQPESQFVVGAASPWPEKSPTDCMWDMHPFDHRPVGIPLEWNRATKKYSMYGYFCNEPCAIAYLVCEMSPEQCELSLPMIYKLARERNPRLVLPIPPAPPRRLLPQFSSHFRTIQDFRSNNGIISTVDYPYTHEDLMCSVAMVCETTSHTPNRNTKQPQQQQKQPQHQHQQQSTTVVNTTKKPKQSRKRSRTTESNSTVSSNTTEIQTGIAKTPKYNSTSNGVYNAKTNTKRARTMAPSLASMFE